MSSLYIDDREEGTSKETSHPNFVAAAPEDFWYSGGDEYTPFGNDSGHDTLRYLEVWLSENGAQADVAEFIKDLIYNAWGLEDRDYLMLTDSQALTKLHYSAEQFLHDMQDQAVIAAAFGQLKITGQAGAEIMKLAGYALARQRAVAETAYTDEKNPFREYAPQYLERVAEFEKLLKRFS